MEKKSSGPTPNKLSFKLSFGIFQLLYIMLLCFLSDSTKAISAPESYVVGQVSSSLFQSKFVNSADALTSLFNTHSLVNPVFVTAPKVSNLNCILCIHSPLYKQIFFFPLPDSIYTYMHLGKLGIFSIVISSIVTALLLFCCCFLITYCCRKTN